MADAIDGGPLPAQTTAGYLSSPETLPRSSRPVRAGRLRGELRGHEMRRICAGDVEVVRHVYVAVRDEAWNTVPATVGDVLVEATRDGFRAQFRCDHAEGDIRLTWDGLIVGGRDGRIELTMQATARQDFRYRRIGFCLLLPCGQYAGRRYRGSGPTGVLSGRLPVAIAPQLTRDGIEQPLFPAVGALTIELSQGLEARFSFEGALFEMEDQRNWTDATLKAYGTPLGLGGPFHAQAGQRFFQRVAIRVLGPPSRPVRRAGRPTLRVGAILSSRAPAVGVGAPQQEAPLTTAQTKLLRALGAAHLRVEVVTGDRESARDLDLAAAAAALTGSALEVALIVADPSDDALAEFAAAVQDCPPARVLAFASEQPVSPAGLCARVRAQLDHVGASDTLVAGGTNANFAELNRERPELSGAEGVTWSINPQVHATDDESLVETLEIQGETVAAARRLYPTLRPLVSPITLRPRFNHDAGQFHERAVEQAELHRTRDARQSTLFCAAWTVGSLRHLALAGASSLTYFQALGPGGVAPLHASPAPVTGAPEAVFPVFHVLGEVTGWRGKRLIELTEPDDVQALGVETARGYTLLVANLRPCAQVVDLVSRSAAGRIRRLDLGTVEQAVLDWAAFSHRWDELEQSGRSSLRLELDAYSVTCVELWHARRRVGGCRPSGR